MKMNILFYEDTKKYKSFYQVLAVLFDTGFVFGVCSIIIYHVIKPVEILTYYQPKGEEYLSTVICLISAIVLNVAIVRSKYFNQSIQITVSEIRLVFNGKQINYNTTELVGYEISRTSLFYREYTLYFTNKRRVAFISSKKRRVSNVFDEIIKTNKVE